MKMCRYQQLRGLDSCTEAQEEYQKVTLDQARRRCRAQHQYFSSTFDTSKKREREDKEECPAISGSSKIHACIIFTMNIHAEMNI